jgi:hypothetical protein
VSVDCRRIERDLADRDSGRRRITGVQIDDAPPGRHVN